MELPEPPFYPATRTARATACTSAPSVRPDSLALVNTFMAAFVETSTQLLAAASMPLTQKAGSLRQAFCLLYSSFASHLRLKTMACNVWCGCEWVSQWPSDIKIRKGLLHLRNKTSPPPFLMKNGLQRLLSTSHSSAKRSHLETPRGIPASSAGCPHEFPVFLSDFPVFLHELLDLDLIQSLQVVHNNVLGTNNRS